MTATLVADDVVVGELPAEHQPYRPGWPSILATLCVLATNVVVITNTRIPWVGPLLGLLLLVGLPTALLVLKVDWHSSRLAERVGYGFVSTLLILMVTGLASNSVLPFFGINHPLTRVPVLVVGDALVVALDYWPREPRWRPSRHFWHLGLSGHDKTVLSMSVICVLLAVVGANRLNNGAGDSVTLVMLLVAGGTLALVIHWRERLDPGVVSFVIYTLSFAMLLATSLRGWYTAGHDSQREFRVFELTKVNGNWNITRFRDPYNACLSITILPTMLVALAKVADPYVYKVFFQAFFALCPLLVYRLCRRFTDRLVALLALVYILCFPTFVNDLPFLNRQEVAFLFVAASLLIMTNNEMPIRSRQRWIALFSVGMVLSHYSTASVFIATVVVTRLLSGGLRVLGPWIGQVGRRLHLPRTHLPTGLGSRPVIGVVNIAVLLLTAFLWIGVVTRTGSNITTTVQSAFSSLGESFSFNAKSSDVAYNLFSFSQPSNAQLLTEYRSLTLTQTGKRVRYYPLSLVDQYPVRAVKVSSPPTKLGAGLDSLGIRVTTANTVIRSGSAKLLQVLVIVGLVAIPISRRRRVRLSREAYLFAVGTLIVLAAEVIVPVVSENYGILRAFMQGLLILSPVLAYGSVILFSRLGARWGPRAAIGLALFMFASLTGLLPQLVGGWDQQLNLDNGGLYYDIYYPHDEEITAANWLVRHVATSTAVHVQAEVETDKFEFQKLTVYSGVDPVNDIFPTFLRRGAYVYLGFQTVRQHVATFAYKGNLVTYTYPTKFLQVHKDLIFTDGGAEVFH